MHGTRYSSQPQPIFRKIELRVCDGFHGLRFRRHQDERQPRILRSGDIRDGEIDDRQENLNVAFGSLAALLVNISLMAASGGKAAVPQ